MLSLDSGGCLEGYIADLCRMAVHDAPTQEQEELHAEVLAIQVAAESAVRAGATGEEVYASAAEVQAKLPHRDVITFVAHGVGLISHEAPRFTDSGPIPYAATHRHRPLEAGMVLSIETELRHPSLWLHQARGHARRDGRRMRALRRAPRVDRRRLTRDRRYAAPIALA